MAAHVVCVGDRGHPSGGWPFTEATAAGDTVVNRRWSGYGLDQNMNLTSSAKGFR